MRNIKFNLNRLYKFILRQLTMNSNSLILGAASIFGFLLILTVATAYFNPYSLDNMMNLHMTVFFIGGYIITSKAFSEINNPKKGYFYLTLPVSALEKVIGSWILTSPLYIICYYAFLFVVFLLASLTANIPFNSTPIFNPNYLENIPVYLVGQTIFFLGATYFRGNNFLKTILSVVLLVIGLSIFSAAVGYALFMDGVQKEDMGEGFLYFVEFDLINILTNAFWYFLGPFLLIVSYFKLKERQI